VKQALVRRGTVSGYVGAKHGLQSVMQLRHRLCSIMPKSRHIADGDGGKRSQRILQSILSWFPFASHCYLIQEESVSSYITQPLSADEPLNNLSWCHR
jgi:hypothetical protein